MFVSRGVIVMYYRKVRWYFTHTRNYSSCTWPLIRFTHSRSTTLIITTHFVSWFSGTYHYSPFDKLMVHNNITHFHHETKEVDQVWSTDCRMIREEDAVLPNHPRSAESGHHRFMQLTLGQSWRLWHSDWIPFVLLVQNAVFSSNFILDHNIDVFSGPSSIDVNCRTNLD